MNDDTSSIPATMDTPPPSEPIEATANYKRWMTDLVGIEDMRLHELAIPGAHNSGVDMAGTWGIAELLGACQNNSFHHQLNVGARYLDLRLDDTSYLKQTGSSAPEYKWTVQFEFTHGQSGFYSNAKRTLQNLVDIARIFSNENPGEFLILDIRKFRKNQPDSLEKAFPHLTPLKNLLIPNSAQDMTVGEIRLKFPGRNIILSFDHGSPKDWKPEWVQKIDLWPTIRHIWSADDSEQNIANLVANTMASPPQDLYWALSAATRSSNGPIHLKADHPIRKLPFQEGKQNVKILMVDFLERPDTIASVTDACIALNRKRVENLSPPKPPKNLTARKLTGQNLQNTVEFNWDRGEDDIGIRQYEIFEGDNLLITTSDIPHREKNLPFKNYTLKVRAVNTTGKRSTFSSPFTFAQDTTPPTAPTHITIGSLNANGIIGTFVPSYDQAGIEHYEVIIGDLPRMITPVNLFYLMNLETETTYPIKIRAKDKNGLYSEYTESEYETYPENLKNPKVVIVEKSSDGDAYTACISWDPPTSTSRDVTCKYSVDGITVPTLGISHGEERPSLQFEGKVGQQTTIGHQIIFGATHGTINNFSFTIARSLLAPITNLRFTSSTPGLASVSWSRSTSTNVTNYAISVNNSSPVLVPSTQTSYQIRNPSADDMFLIEIWAVGNFTLPSVVVSLPITIPPLKPDAPSNFRYIPLIVSKLEWDAPSQPVNGYRVVLIGPGGNELLYSTTEPKLAPLLLPKTRYDARITASNDSGESPPLIAEFTTR
ncbi:hypothetical protein [Pseudomonas sp. NFX15]|uniref:hypothetical protein n=1 Tax=Pseudomonas sp. NFX15 TaxID=2816958 RepID=UPI003B8E860B